MKLRSLSPAAQDALDAIKKTIDFDTKRDMGLDVDGDKVRRFVLEGLENPQL